MNDLIKLDWQDQTVTIDGKANELKAAALALAAEVWGVNNAATQDEAVKAQAEINGVLALVEKARKAAKEPALEFGRRIDDAAKAFVADLKPEQLRIAKLVGDFQAIEEARVRAAQQAQNQQLTELERRKAEEIAKAHSHAEIETIQALYNQRAAELNEPIVAARAEGQRVTQDWDVTVNDIHMLYRAHPNCVTLTPLVGEIKSLLKAGISVKGVVAKQIQKSTTTTKRLIEI